MNTKRILIIFIAVMFAIFLGASSMPGLTAQAAPEAVCFVKWNASGTGNNGTSWTNAYKGFLGVQNALANASCTSIWVAAGEYLPSNDNNRAATFQLKNGVALYGGFAGTESAVSQRNIIANETILSGNVGSEFSSTDNAYHVVTGSGTITTAILDGFTIKDGRADATSGDNRLGAGMFIDTGTPTIRNVTFMNNYAVYGGGLYFQYSAINFSQVTFLSNTATAFGGGLYSKTSNYELVNATFLNNQANDGGGGIFNIHSNPTLTHLTIVDNNTDGPAGGGIYNNDTDGVIANTIFWGNTAATNNHQILNTSGSTPAISNSIVQGGIAGGTNIITSDPKLGAFDGYGGSMKVIPLRAGSPAVDAGNGTHCAVVDERGILRSGQGTACDIGAYEFIPVLYAKPGTNTKGLCQSWVVSCDLKYALSLAVTGQQIWAKGGTYLPGTLKTESFQLKNGVALYGGFNGTETSLSQRNPTANESILSGDIYVRGALVDNSYHVVVGSATNATAVLDGFVITQGNANGTGANALGGGLYIISGSPTLRNLVIKENYANVAGGGIFASGSSSMISSSAFLDNGSPNGGGIFNSDSSLTLLNVTMSNKGDKGAAIYNNHSSPTITHATLFSHSGFNGSSPWGAIFNEDRSSPVIRNSIIWGTEGAEPEIYNYDVDCYPVVSDSVVEGGYSAGTKIYTNDPWLGPLGFYGGWTPTVPISFLSSIAKDRADDTYCPLTDQRGMSRPQGNRCDIGAYEINPVLYASPGGRTSGFCESWANACELRYALPISFAGQEIWVKEGIHRPTNGTDRTATFQLTSDVYVYGGFSGTETSRLESDWIQNVTYLDGNIGNNGLADNSYHVVNASNTGPSTGLVGFVIRFGNADGDFPNNRGGGIYSSNGAPWFRDLQIVANTALENGGGMHIFGGFVSLQNVEFSYNEAAKGGGLNIRSGQGSLSNVLFLQNKATDVGGGLAIESNDMRLHNVSFLNNQAVGGGGVFNYASPTEFKDVTFNGNSASHSGGGMLVSESDYVKLYRLTFLNNSAIRGGGLNFYNSPAIMQNLTFYGNKADEDGGAIILERGGCPSCPPAPTGLTTLVNATISGNSARNGGGIYFNSDNLEIENTILWGNTGEYSPQIAYSPTQPRLVIANSVIEIGYPLGGTNIIMNDPMLGTLDDYGGLTKTIPLLEGSSAIDTGNDAKCPATDQRGIWRPKGFHCDIGAYESEEIAFPLKFYLPSVLR